jgi:hypothetical protein
MRGKRRERKQRVMIADFDYEKQIERLEYSRVELMTCKKYEALGPAYIYLFIKFTICTCILKKVDLYDPLRLKNFKLIKIIEGTTNIYDLR